MPQSPSRPQSSANALFDDTERVAALVATGLLDSDPEAVFDRTAALASRLLGSKVSLVSLVDDTRQFFKARVGLDDPDLRETPLTHSFCKHVVTTNEPLVVPDAREHPTLRENPAIRELDIVAYLGVPIRSTDGHVLGSFCAIEPKPRAWSKADLATLEDLALGLESEIALREALAASSHAEERYRSILDLLPIGVAVAAAPSAELLLVNGLGAELLDEEVTANQPSDYRALGAQHADGRRYSAEEYPIVRAATSGETVANEPMTYHRSDGRDIELEVSASRLETNPPLAVATFIDITKRQEAIRQTQSAKDQLVQVLEATTDGVFVVDREWTLTFLNSHAQRMIAGTTDPTGKNLWKAFPHMTGGQLAEIFTQAMQTGEPTQTDDLQEQNDVWFEARAFPGEEGMTVFLRDVTEKRKSDETRQLLVRELNHRVKNLFAVVSGMISMTARHTRTPREMSSALRGRLFALAQAHELIRPAVTLDAVGQPDVSLQNLVTTIIEPHILHPSDEIAIEGKAISLGANGATSLALVLHELATNAAKYGSLSVPDGHLSIKWKSEADRLHFHWHETRGPGLKVAAEDEPQSVDSGFGSTLIDMSIKTQLHGTLSHQWQDDGVCISMVLPMVRLQS